MGWKTFNDRLALLLIVLIPCLWLVSANYAPLPGEVIGATITEWPSSMTPILGTGTLLVVFSG